ADGVEDLVLHPQHPRHQVQVAADQLRFEQLAESPRIQGAAVEDRLVRRRFRVAATVPAAHELAEIDVADLGAVEATHAGGDGLCGHDAFRSPGLRARWLLPAIPGLPGRRGRSPDLRIRASRVARATVRGSGPRDLPADEAGGSGVALE